MREEKIFRLQIIQDMISANHSLPIRVMKKDALDIAYGLIDKKGKFCQKNNINNREAFAKFITQYIENIPNFYDKNIAKESIDLCRKSLYSFMEEDIKKISKSIFLTYASFHPKLYRKLKKENTFFTLVIMTALYISIRHEKESEVSVSNNFHFDTMVFDDNIVIVGPRCPEDNFKIFIQNIIDIFDLNFHSFELEMLHEDYSNDYNLRLNRINSVFRKYVSKALTFEGNFVLSQSDVKKLAMFVMRLTETGIGNSYISISSGNYIQYIDSQYIFLSSLKGIEGKEADIIEIDQRIKRHYHFFQLEAFNSIGENLYSKFIPFGMVEGNDGEFKNAILKALRRLVYADAVLFYNYEESRSKFSLLESDGLSTDEEKDIEAILKKVNSQTSGTSESLTQKIVSNYYTNRQVGLLNNHVKYSDDSDMMQPFRKKAKFIKSVLSVPLIFDHKIRGVLHFFSYRENAFDAYNKRFLFQFSDFLTHLTVESIFLKRQSDIIGIMNKDDFEPKKQSEELKKIATYIADVFASDGVMIFLHSQDILIPQSELNSIHLQASIGIDINGYKQISINENDSFIGKEGKTKDKIIICPDMNNIKSSDMKYYKIFVDSKIQSFIAINITGDNDKLEGAIVVVDKVRRKYNALSRRMLSILSEEVRLLNILNRQIYNQQVDKEKVLHEIKQTFISLTKETIRLDRRLKNGHIKFLSDNQKNNIYKNIEDIKLSAKTSIAWVNNFFRGDRKKVTSYNYILKKDIDEINKHIVSSKKFTPIRNICLSVLKGNTISFNEFELEMPPSLAVNLPNTILKKVFSNIIGNAIKYRKPRTAISISMQKEKGYLQIYIVNVGIAIHADERDRIFEENVRGRLIISDEDNELWQPRGDENRGLGCYYVRMLTGESKWKGTFNFQEINQLDDKYSKNRFILEFPMYIVKGA